MTCQPYVYSFFMPLLEGEFIWMKYAWCFSAILAQFGSVAE